MWWRTTIAVGHIVDWLISGCGMPCFACTRQSPELSLAKTLSAMDQDVVDEVLVEASRNVDSMKKLER